MNLKNMVQLSHALGEEAVHLFCAANTSLPFLKDALFQFVNYVANLEQQIKAQQDAQAEKQKQDNAPVQDHPVDVEQKPE